VNQVTRILTAIETGNPRATEELSLRVQDELRHVAARRLPNERPGLTLPPTAPGVFGEATSPEATAASTDQFH